VAKSRKPQDLSLQDLVDYAASMMGGKTTPTVNPTAAMGQAMNRATVKYLDPRDFGKPNNLATDTWDYGLSMGLPIPLPTAEETRRLVDKGPDRGHLASLALLAAFMKAPKVVKGIRTAMRGAESISKNKGVQPIKPVRQQGANVAGQTMDPMAQYAILSALLNRR